MRKKMNILFFITDQQRADHLGCAGNPILKTPNLDRLASEGVRFSSAYVASPTCMPNRASIMTGQYPNMCVRAYGVNLNTLEHLPKFPDILRKRGYVTKAIGKMHFNYWARDFTNSKSVELIPKWISKNKSKQLKQEWSQKLNRKFS